MNIEKLFQVIVAMGASSTVGLAACSSSTSGNGGPSSDDGGANGPSDGSGTTDGAPATTGGDGSACAAACHPDSQETTWIDCNGCCCWLPAGATSPASTPICGVEPCCAGRGR